MTHGCSLMRVLRLAALALPMLLAACGSGGDPEPESVAITAQPADQGVFDGANASFAVAAVHATGYRWQRDSGAGFEDVSGATQASLSVAPARLAMSGHRFRVVVSGPGGPVTSRVATLTVGVAPVAPAITADPAAAAVSAGQAADFAAAASGVPTPSLQWQASRDAGAHWSDLPGEANASLRFSSTVAADNGLLVRLVATNSAGSARSSPARLAVCAASVREGFGGDLEALYPGGFGGSAGDGTSGASDDGGGDDGAGGGLGKTVGALVVVTRIADGTELGRAKTDAARGMVTVHLCPDTGPLLLTMQGADGATYFDESRNAYVPFGTDQVLHALVDQGDENLGVTPLTEAAYRYALNQYVADPTAVRAGTTPLLRTGSVTGLAKEKIQAANQRVLDEINRVLPDGYRLDSLKSMPTPVDAGAGSGALRASRYGRMQAVTGGLVEAAGLHRTDLVRPALAALDQIANDLTDGRIDGFALDGRAVSAGSDATYDSVRLPVAVTVGANSQSQRFGADTLLAAAPRIAEVGFAKALYPDSCPANQDLITLTKNGTVAVRRQSILPPSGPGQCSGISNGAETFPGFATGVRQLYGNGTQAYVVDAGGHTLAWGSATCGLLADGRASGLTTSATRVPALDGFTSFAAGLVSVAARRNDGKVVTFGSDINGTLGLGATPATDTLCVPQYNVAGEFGALKARPTNLTPRLVPGLDGIVSVHALNQARDSFFAIAADGGLYAWGYGFAGAFGDGVVDPAFDNGIAGFLMSPTRYTPSRVDGIDGVRAVTSAGFSFFALRVDGSVWGWGSNSDRTFGDGSNTGKSRPQPVPGVAGAREIAGEDSYGGRTMYVLLGDGSVLTWSGENGKLGLNAGTWPALPLRAIAGLPKIRHLMAVAADTGAGRFALAEDGRVFLLHYDVFTNQVLVDDWTPFFP